MVKVAYLIMSKGKLATILQIGDSYRNELCSTVYAARLKVWICEQTGLTFKEHIPFLDLKIIQAMIRKSSYGFNTFVGLRVAEIQNKMDVDRWLHIPSEENVADIITREPSPNNFGPSSIWQTGPLWLVKDISEWPATRANEGVCRMKFKNFVLKRKFRH